jgi:PPOX class probable F420-dependent enzyme
MEPREARSRFAAARVARLATADAAGRPHLVPVAFALDADRVYSAIDDVKPKATRRLKRLQNIAANPAVSILADHYEDDWEKLWWVRADGEAYVVEDEAELERARELLRTKYPQYGELGLDIGGAIAIDVSRWSSWSYR